MKNIILLLFLYSANLFSQSWYVIDPTTISGTPDFSDVFFTDDNAGWITTTSSSNIYKTADGTTSFSTQTTPLGGTSAIHMLDANNGYSGGGRRMGL